MSTSRLPNLRKNKDIVITRPDKGNGGVILHRKLFDNAYCVKKVQIRSLFWSVFGNF